MSVIVPAILPKSRADLEEKLAQLVGRVESVQIDIIDGRFVSPPSWPYVEPLKEIHTLFAEGEMLPYVDQLKYEMDLMVSAPEEVTGIWIEAGAAAMTIHAESTQYLPRAITDMQVKYGHEKNFAPGLLSLGLAINIDTDISLIEPYLHSADYVQFMGIAKIGRQGEPFDQRVIRKITQFRHAHPDVLIQVDGGVSLLTAPALLSAGVDRLIVGSALWNAPDLEAELEKFNSLVQEFGTY
jgi:ribulose-phosphate 3-epimerase